jgi:hypothetical protein
MATWDGLRSMEERSDLRKPSRMTRKPAVRRKRLGDEIAIPDVPSNDDGSCARDALDTSDHFDIAIAEIVKNDDLVAGIDQFDTCMGPDVTGPARDHNLHVEHRFRNRSHRFFSAGRTGRWRLPADVIGDLGSKSGSLCTTNPLASDFCPQEIQSISAISQ